MVNHFHEGSDGRWHEVAHRECAEALGRLPERGHVCARPLMDGPRSSRVSYLIEIFGQPRQVEMDLDEVSELHRRPGL